MIVMMRRICVSALLLGLGIGIGIATHRRSEVSAGGACVPLNRLSWGVALQTDQPFYNVGGSVRVSGGPFNRSGTDGFGWANQGGPNGCEYRITITDSMGQVVWEPGSIFQSQFSPAICGQVIVNQDLVSPGQIVSSDRIPLIFQNGGGVGTLGASLPAGVYSIDFSIRFNGPNRMSGPVDSGLDHSASVPIRIEP